MRDRHDRRMPGDFGQRTAALRSERPVDRRHHRLPGYPAPPGQLRPHDGVVVDDIHVGQRLIGGQDVRCLLGAGAHRLDRRPEEPLPRYGARRLADGEQPHVVAACHQTAREITDDHLGTAAGGRRHRDPRRGNQPDPHSRAPAHPSSAVMNPPSGYRGTRGCWPRWIYQQSTAIPDRGHHPRWGELHRAIMCGWAPPAHLAGIGRLRIMLIMRSLCAPGTNALTRPVPAPALRSALATHHGAGWARVVRA